MEISNFSTDMKNSKFNEQAYARITRILPHSDRFFYLLNFLKVSIAISFGEVWAEPPSRLAVSINDYCS